METISLFSSKIEYEQWLGDNREYVLEYVEENDVAMGELPLSARAFNILRMNDITRMSQLVTRTSYEISQLPQLGKMEIDEVLGFRRQYLKTHRNNLFAFVTAQKNISLNNNEEIDSDIEEQPQESKDKAEACVLSVVEDKNKARDKAKAKILLSHPATNAKLITLLRTKNCLIKKMNFSVRAYNGLIGAGITDMLKVIERYPDGFGNIHALGSKTVREICHIVEEYVGEYLGEIDVPEERANIINILFESETPIDTLGLSIRSYNALRRAQIQYVYQALELYPDGFSKLRNLGQKSVQEIVAALEKFAADMLVERSDGVNEDEKTQDENIDDVQMSVDTSSGFVNTDLPLIELLRLSATQEKAWRCVKEMDIPIEEMGFSVRAIGALKLDGRFTFSAIIPIYLYPESIASMKNAGVKTIAEIQERTEHYLEKMQPIVAAYCAGADTAREEVLCDVIYTDEYIIGKILESFKNSGFAGLSFQQMRAKLPEEIRESRIKKCIGSLIADNQLEYVDFRCYRVYPSVFNVLDDEAFTEEEKTMLYRRMSGETLEAIAIDRGVTRERVRQIIKKKIKYLRTYALRKYSVRFVDEDFYSYLYENYDVEKEVWFDYLGISEKIYGFLVNAYSRGRQKIESALSDPQVNLTLKYKIREYLNRNKIMVDGILMENQRSAIEDYALSKFARDEMSYDEFVDHYNGLLQDNGIIYNEKLYYTEEVRRARSNRLASSMCCLWKQGERLRFYNIDARDYTELFETLNLGGFQNTEISTLKFFNEYPNLMEKYDIRDQYELHNLLKKVVDPQTCHDVSFHRQPMIGFGEFDRTKAIYEIIEAFSPITAEDLAEYVHSEYGYDKGTAWSYFQPLLYCYHQGVFSANFKRIPDNRVAPLIEELTEEFYYISEIREIYAKLFTGADVDEINHRSLKHLGFTVLEKYALRGYNTADEFFTSILTRDDVFSLDALNRRYGATRMFYNKVWEMRRNLDIILFESNQYINFQRLAKLGITKNDLWIYINAVYEHVEENTYFTIPSLKDAFETKLDDLGFGMLFYAGLLAASGKFEHTYCYGTPLFYKGQLSGSISIRGFLLEALAQYDSVDLDDFINDCEDQYGVRIPSRYEVTGVLSGTDFYYDNIMGKIYRNKSYYYAEFDE